MEKPDYVLFDCDGVLVNSEPVTCRVLRDSLAAHGLDLRLDQVVDMFVGGTMADDMIRGRELGAALPNDWLEMIYAETFAALEQECQIILGIAGVLDHLDAARIGYAVGSNGPMAKMDVTLRRCGLWDRFEGRIFSAYDCAAPKPAPDVYLKAAAMAGMIPEQCVVIEDSASGARAGKAAGMRCFGYTADTSREKLAPHCDVLFEDMSKLPELLGL